MKALVVSMVGATLLMLFGASSGHSQEMMTIKPTQPIICYQAEGNLHDHVGVSERFRNSRQARTKTASIQVEYVNFPGDGVAKAAFEYAVGIWETELVSTVPIRIRADWRPLGTGVLGQAIWGSAYANFGGEQHMNVFYPVALAEKIAGRHINHPSEPDIYASFNSSASWYFETDGNTPAGQIDMVTIVLHEIAHGLGFTDTYDVVGSQGSVGLQNGVPFVFDLFVQNQADKNLIHSFESPSSDLAVELQSTRLFLSSQLATAALEGIKPKLYAPSKFDNGSSISHLDESTFSGLQDANRLMTPHIAAAESIHDPGEVLLATLADIGWIGTQLTHTPLRDTERRDGQPYNVSVRVRSDNGYTPGTVNLHYTTNGQTFTTVTMQPSGNPHEYAYSLPGTTSELTYAYYISAEDLSDRRFTSPGLIHQVGSSPEQGLHIFRIGPDGEAPEIVHSPVRYVSNVADLSLVAEVRDNQQMGSVAVEYRINDGSIQTISMSKGVDPDEYVATIELPALAVNDVVEYRLVARDAAMSQNTATAPEEDFYIVDVTGILPTQDSYVNDFNTPSTDFFGDGFSIITPQGFSSGAIHTNHPYENGSGPKGESNYTFQLQIPVRISAKDPMIRFDEVVLVEPGEEGASFGDPGFYDYVIVEGSADRGATWQPLSPGYDSRAHNAWHMRFSSRVSNDNSLAVGDEDLFVRREINMVESGAFAEGDEVLIRFRLFADPLAYGWGWAIDNLAIQAPITSLEKPAPWMGIYPNPARNELFLSFMSQDIKQVAIEILDVAGRIVYTGVVSADDAIGREAMIDLRSFETGLYVLRARAGRELFARKFLKAGE